MPAPDLKHRKGAIVKAIGCGLCGSDIVKVVRGLVPAGTVLGHEVVGIITELNLTSDSPFKIGDKVAVAHHVPCNNCRYCQQESYSMCKTFKNSNLEPGGFAELIYLSELHVNNTVINIPDTMDELKASFMEPIACILRSVSRANVSPDQNVLVVGLGAIGLLFIQVLKLYNTFVIGCDLINERITLAQIMGADLVFNPENTKDSSEFVNNSIDFKGVDLVVLASGSSASIELALNSVRDGGKILVFASIPKEDLGYFNNAIYYRELSIVGAYSSSPEYLPASMNLLRHDKIKVNEFSQTMGIEDINSAIRKIIAHEAMKVYLKL